MLDGTLLLEEGVWRLHVVAAFVYAAMAVYLLRKGPRTALVLACAAIPLCFCHWSLCLAVCHHPTVTKEVAHWGYSVGSLAWASFASVAAYFILTFSRPDWLRRRLVQVGLILPPALVVHAQWSGWMAADLVARPWGWGYVWADSFWPFFFFTYYGVVMLGGLGLLFATARRDPQQLRRRQAWIISAWACIPLLLSTLTDVWLPLAGYYDIPNMAPDFTIIWVAALVYAIAKHRALSLTPSLAADDIVAGMSEALFVVDEDGKVAVSNEAAKRLVDDGAVKGRTFNELIGPVADEAMTAEPTARLEMEIGNKKTVLLSKAPLTVGAERPVGTVYLAADITELKEKERALEEARGQLEQRVEERTRELAISEARTRSLIESMQEGLGELDEHGRLRFVNPRLALMLDGAGRKAGRDSWVGAKLSSVVRPGSKEALQRALELAQKGETVEQDLELAAGWPPARPKESGVIATNRGGSVRRVIARLAPLEGETKGTVVTLIDITEREHMRSRLEQAERMASLGQLAAGIGHEINNPLMVVLESLRTLMGEERELPTERGDTVLRDALEHAGRVQGILSELRHFARLDDRRVAAVSLKRVVETALSMAQHELRYRARVTRALEEVGDVRANEGHLVRAVLSIVLELSQGFSHDEMGELRVATRMAKDDRGRETVAILELEAIGASVPARRVEALEQGGESLDSMERPGLGLSIVRRALAESEGQLSVERNDDGIRLTVEIPRVPALLVAAMPRWEPVVTSRILVIDDEAALRRVLVRLLRKHHQVVVAESGRAAVELLEEDAAFDAVLCDMMMPGMTGMELFGYLQKKHPSLAKRMVFMTGGVFTPEAQELLRTTTNPLITKPFRPEQLDAALVEVLGPGAEPALQA